MFQRAADWRVPPWYRVECFFFCICLWLWPGGVHGRAEKVVKAAERLLKKEPLTFTEVRDALVTEFPGVNDRALGYCTRMMVPLVMYPTDVRWSWSANARFTPAKGWLSGRIRASAVPE